MKKYFYDEYGRINWLYILFGLQVAGFLLAFFTTLIFQGAAANFFAIHSGDSWSLLKVWKLALYSFAEATVWGLISDLIWLGLFGTILSSIIGSKEVFNLYIIAAVVMGFLAGIICLIPQSYFLIYLLGATTPHIAIVSACLYKAPKYKVPMMLIGEIPIWILAIIFFLIKIFIAPSTALLFMMFISLLTIPLGIFYIKYIEAGNSLAPSNFFTKRKPKGKVVAFSKTEKNAPTTNTQEQLNKILDKISATGINSLSKAEKAFLESYSKK